MTRTCFEWMEAFRRSRRGNVAILLAVSLVPVILIVGAAVDFSRAHLARTELQAALDAAALAVATSSPKLTDKQRIAIGEEAFDAHVRDITADLIPDPDITIDDNTVHARGSIDLSTTLMNVAGIADMSVGASSEVRMPGFGPAEVVLALDYSSSMDDQYGPMRDAAIALIETITLNRTSSDVKVGLVPFAEFVYVTLPGAHVLDGSGSWTNCTTGRRWPWVKSDATPTGDGASKWGRTDGDDTIDADEYDGCSDYVDNDLFVRPLTTNHGGTIAQLEDMTPDNGTNIAVGMEFALHLISPTAPFTQAVPFTNDAWRKIVVLLSDGAHNRPGFGPGGIYTADQGAENLDLICDAMKSEDVLVLTVAYELDDDDGKDQLKSCASGTQYYFEAEEDTIDDIFEAIGDTLATNVYVSR